MRGKYDFVLGRIGLQSEEAAQERADDHCSRPYLVRGIGGERLIIIPREHLGDVAE
jgi:hypothetical protein